jgi:hypothetical protein
MRLALRKLARLVTRHRDDEDFREELEANLQLHIDDNVRAGMSPDEARRSALVKLGGPVALGATARSVLWLVVSQSAGYLVLGLAFGLIGAFGIRRALSGILFHTAPTDPLTYAVIFLAFLAATLAACLIPAVRTARVDPAASLRLQ